MTQRTTQTDFGKTIVCVSSYEHGVPKGWLYTPYMEPEPFESLTQLLLKIENMLDLMQGPQAHTVTRTFFPQHDLIKPLPGMLHLRKGPETTFEIRICFRQHTSWQGTITWRDRKMEKNFRSALELILLMDSALRAQQGCDTA